MKATRFERLAPWFGLVVLVGWLAFTLVSNNTTLFTKLPFKDASSSKNQSQEKPPTYTPEDLLAETNKERAKVNVSALALDPVLNDTAQRKCEDMAAKNEYEHGEVAPYFDPLDRTLYSENIVYGYDSAKGTINSFVGSPAHYAAMIDVKYTRVGFGICPFRDSKLVVQHFSNEPVTPPSPQETNSTGQVHFTPYEYSIDPSDYSVDYDFKMPDYSKPHRAPTYTPPTPTISSGTNYGNGGGCDSSAAQYIPQCN